MCRITTEEFQDVIGKHLMLTATKEELEDLIHARRGIPDHNEEKVVVAAHLVLEQRYKRHRL